MGFFALENNYTIFSCSTSAPSQERRQKEEEAQAHENMQIAQEAAVAKMAKDMNNEVTACLLSYRLPG